MADSFFRAGVGAIILNSEGKIFAGRRGNAEGRWQLPQGGLHPDEDPLEGAFREIFEETGIGRDDLTLVKMYPDWVAYEFPAAITMWRNSRGQLHRWYLFRYTGMDADIDLSIAPDNELAYWKWMSAQEILERSIPFKRDVYRKLFEFVESFRADPG